jgi:hypothetical protein
LMEEDGIGGSRDRNESNHSPNLPTPNPRVRQPRALPLLQALYAQTLHLQNSNYISSIIIITFVCYIAFYGSVRTVVCESSINRVCATASENVKSAKSAALYGAHTLD